MNRISLGLRRRLLRVDERDGCYDEAGFGKPSGLHTDIGSAPDWCRGACVIAYANLAKVD
jgi:hypothetical protein